jgi:hypothetical protein
MEANTHAKADIYLFNPFFLNFDGKKNKNSFAKLQDYHKVLAVALSSFTKCYEDGGFYWKDAEAEGNEILPNSLMST